MRWRGQAGGRRRPEAKADSRKASKTGRCFRSIRVRYADGRELCERLNGAQRRGQRSRRLNLGAQRSRALDAHDSGRPGFT